MYKDNGSDTSKTKQKFYLYIVFHLGKCVDGYTTCYTTMRFLVTTSVCDICVRDVSKSFL